MIVPVLQHDELVNDIKAAAVDRVHFHLWWLGQSGFVVQWQGRHLLFDPYLSDSLTKKYAGTDKPHVRMTELAVDPRKLDFIDVVTSSHNHTDHLDGETLLPLLEVNSKLALIVPAANLQFAANRLRVDPTRLTPIDDRESVEMSGFQITAVRSAHETVERDEQGRCRFLGYIARFGSWTVYHSGDTVLYRGLAKRLREWSVDVALLPINGSRPERRVAGNLWGHEAAQLAKDIHARMVIPCHFDMFEFNTVTPDQFVHAAAQLGQPQRVLKCGERWSSSELARLVRSGMPCGIKES